MTKPRFDQSNFSNEALENDPRAFLQAAIDVADYYGFEANNVKAQIDCWRGHHVPAYYYCNVKVSKINEGTVFLRVTDGETPLQGLSFFIDAIEAHLKGGQNG